MNLVEPMGFEPTTFPVSPGRAQQLRNHPVILPGFELPFAAHRFAARFVQFGKNEPPWTAVFQGFGVVGVVVREALGNVLRLSNVEAAGRFALEDVEVIHRCEFGGADGVRTHDLLDAIEARSQLRHGPTEVRKYFSTRWRGRRRKAAPTGDSKNLGDPLHDDTTAPASEGGHYRVLAEVGEEGSGGAV